MFLRKGEGRVGRVEVYKKGMERQRKGREKFR